jgi:hypothetical protein
MWQVLIQHDSFYDLSLHAEWLCFTSLSSTKHGHALEEATRPGRSPFPSLASDRMIAYKARQAKSFRSSVPSSNCWLLQKLRVALKIVQLSQSTKQLHRFHA